MRFVNKSDSIKYVVKRRVKRPVQPGEIVNLDQADVLHSSSALRFFESLDNRPENKTVKGANDNNTQVPDFKTPETESGITETESAEGVPDEQSENTETERVQDSKRPEEYNNTEGDEKVDEENEEAQQTEEAEGLTDEPSGPEPADTADTAGEREEIEGLAGLSDPKLVEETKESENND